MNNDFVRPTHAVSQPASLQRFAMSRGVFVALALGTAALLPAAPAFADTASVEKAVRATGKPGRLEAVSIQTTATVEKVDYKTRQLTLKSNEGKELTLEAGSEVKRLDEIKKGDVLEVEYVESIAVSVEEPGAKSETPDGAYSVLVRNPTQSPSGKLIDTETVSATVQSVDVEKRIVELLRPDGISVKIAVSPDVQRLQDVKKGDTVAVKYTRSVALSIHKPAPK
jgi:Cu/Ag efflux protein CusF